MSTEGVNPNVRDADDTSPSDGEAGPSSPSELDRTSWRYVIERTIREFRRDGCLDQSAALAFRSTLAVFPVLLVIVSALGLLGETSRFTNFIVDTVSSLGSTETSDTVRALFEALAKAPAGYAFALGLLLTLWSASGYVSAFGRAMNRIYGFREGRIAWKLRLSFVPLGALLVLLILAGIAALFVGGNVADAVAGELALTDGVVLVWSIVRIPLALLLAVLVIALLYFYSPNVRHPKIRWMSIGALVALLVWIAASGGLVLYFANFSSFDRSYGAIGGGLVFLLWLWVTNIALLVGGEFDAELERMRQLQHGRNAENRIRLPMRDTSAAITAINSEIHDTIAARELKEAAIREQAGVKTEPSEDGRK